jgi:hypothetical protein
MTAIVSRIWASAVAPTLPRVETIRPVDTTRRCAQSVPERSGTTRLLMARRGTKGQFKGYANCLTSALACTDNAEADGSIPSSPTKDLMKGHSWRREHKHSHAEVDKPSLKR